MFENLYDDIYEEQTSFIHHSDYDTYIKGAQRYDFITNNEKKRLKGTKPDFKFKNFMKVGFKDPEAVGFSVKNVYLEKGAERVTYLMTEVDKDGMSVGQPMVAKDSLHEFDQKGQLKFQLQCGTTQTEAARIADTFNGKTQNQLHLDIPTIEFLMPTFYEGTD